jgi:hypothetical protein
MFCPQCKAEYRQGFTRCADCDVELVWELPANAIVAHESAATGDPEEDPFCSFWKGDDPRIHAEICELLDKESIPYKTVRREDHLFHFSNYPAFQLGIPFSMFERGEAAVKEAYGGDEAIEPASRLLPMGSDHIHGTRFDAGGIDSGVRDSRQSSQDREDTPGVEGSLDSTRGSDYTDSGVAEDDENWNGEEAVVEIWSGDEPELAEFIAASLEPEASAHSTSVLRKKPARVKSSPKWSRACHRSETRLTLGCLPDISSAPIRDGDSLNSFSSLRLDVSLAPDRGYALRAWRDTWLRLLDRKAR